MKECVTVQTENSTLPPNKRTNYAYGMVMDVDAFRQEQTHFEWKHALGNRLLHGYGTVCGLRLHAEPDGPDVRILVEPGYAVNPQGQWIWVEEQLCALLNAWVQNNQDENDGFLAPGANQVYITLCYDECPTDLVPIAGKACATEEDTRAPSRILETLRAEFSWEPPDQLGEDTAELFGWLLSMVTITDEAAEDESDFFLDLVATLGLDESPMLSPPGGLNGSPVESPLASPPESGEILLWQETACDTIQQALVLWATEVCPRLQDTDETCILLGCIDFQVDLGGRVLPATVEVSDCDRPVLVPTRLQQELFCLLNGEAVEGVEAHADLSGLDADDHPQYFNETRGDARYALLNHNHTLDNLSNVNAAGASNGDVLRRVGGGWVAGPVGGGPTALDDLSDVNAPGPNTGEVLTFRGGEWRSEAHDHDLDDLGDVNAAGPADGEVLTFRGGTWQPESNPHSHGLDDLDDVDAPGPNNRDVLVFDGGANQWRANSANYVDRPPAAGPYAIVAAGWFAVDGSVQAAPYNDLEARPLANPQGDYVLNFNGYANPTGARHIYIIKGTVQDLETTNRLRSTFEFVRFQDNGIRVRVLQVNGEPLQREQGFMVEISGYGLGG